MKSLACPRCTATVAVEPGQRPVCPSCGFGNRAPARSTPAAPPTGGPAQGPAGGTARSRSRRRRRSRPLIALGAAAACLLVLAGAAFAVLVATGGLDLGLGIGDADLADDGSASASTRPPATERTRATDVYPDADVVMIRAGSAPLWWSAPEPPCGHTGHLAINAPPDSTRVVHVTARLDGQTILDRTYDMTGREGHSRLPNVCSNGVIEVEVREAGQLVANGTIDSRQCDYAVDIRIRLDEGAEATELRMECPGYGYGTRGGREEGPNRPPGCPLVEVSLRHDGMEYRHVTATLVGDGDPGTSKTLRMYEMERRITHELAFECSRALDLAVLIQEEGRQDVLVQVPLDGCPYNVVAHIYLQGDQGPEAVRSCRAAEPACSWVLVSIRIPDGMDVDATLRLLDGAGAEVVDTVVRRTSDRHTVPSACIEGPAIQLRIAEGNGPPGSDRMEHTIDVSPCDHAAYVEVRFVPDAHVEAALTCDRDLEPTQPHTPFQPV